ncbi:MAG TPA: GNAT family N-acetyltransferase [Terriglobales bacterium]|nr:GNAT family N-acetyltransferase [Terriglobales bacterium]
MFRIRPAEEQDAERIAAVVNAAFEVERPMRASGERTSPQGVREEMQRGTFFVAEQEGRIVGTVLTRINGTTGYFGMLAVESGLQGSGIGRALREHAEAHCKTNGCSQMTLTTGDFRTELPPYYARAGYRIVSYEPNSGSAWNLSKPFQIVHMAKDL